MATHMDACNNISIPISISERRMATYPPIRDMCELEVDMIQRAVKILKSDLLIDHLNMLVDRIVSQRLQEETATPGVDKGDTTNSLIGDEMHQSAPSLLKSLLPHKRHQILEMWNDDNRQFDVEPYKIGKIIHDAGVK